MKTYWLHWQFNSKGFDLLDGQMNKLGMQAFDIFWPSITLEQSQGSVLLECHEKGIRAERDVRNQNLDVASKLPFKNTWVVATPKHDDFIGDYIECTYEVKE